MLIPSEACIASSPPSASRLAITLVSDFATLARLQPEWLELLARSAANEAMLTPFWLLAWWEVFGEQDGRRLQVLLFREDQRLVGLAPLLSRRHWYPPGIPFRRLEPLGTGERERDAICSDYLNIIAEHGYEERVAEALARTVTSGALGPWDELVLPMMNGEGPMPPLLVAAFQAVGAAAEVVQTGGAPFIPLPTTWDHYLLTLGKKHRYRVHRAQRDFEEWAGGPWRVDQAASPEDLAKGQQILVDLHHDRWDGVANAGVFRSPHFVRFHDKVMERLLEQGALELLWLSVRDEPIAASYSLVWEGKVYYYQCGRKTGLPPQVRPGSILLHHAIRTAIERKRREFDFLNGLAPYKLYLALAVRPLVQVRVARSSFVERLRRLARRGWKLAKGARAALRQSPPASHDEPTV